MNTPIWGWKGSLRTAVISQELDFFPTACPFPENSPLGQIGIPEHRQKCASSNNTKHMFQQCRVYTCSYSSCPKIRNTIYMCPGCRFVSGRSLILLSFCVFSPQSLENRACLFAGWPFRNLRPPELQRGGRADLLRPLLSQATTLRGKEMMWRNWTMTFV